MDSEYLRFVLALILVIGLILLLAWALRRFGLGGMSMSGGSKRRLQVLETTAAGPRHRLVLVRRDQSEHLLLLGPTGDLIIEQGITAKSQPGKPAAADSFDQALRAEARAADREPGRLDLHTLRAERTPGDEGQSR